MGADAVLVQETGDAVGLALIPIPCGGKDDHRGAPLKLRQHGAFRPGGGQGPQVGHDALGHVGLGAGDGGLGAVRIGHRGGGGGQLGEGVGGLFLYILGAKIPLYPSVFPVPPALLRVIVNQGLVSFRNGGKTFAARIHVRINIGLTAGGIDCGKGYVIRIAKQIGGFYISQLAGHGAYLAPFLADLQ